MLQFCVEGYLSAWRGGGPSQGLPANGPYKSLFRAGSRPWSESRASASNHHKTSAATPAPASSLHVLAEAAQSPEVLSPVSATASRQPTPTTPAPAPAPTSDPTSKKRRRKPSPLIESTSPVAPLDLISATRSSPVASSSSSQSHIIIDLTVVLLARANKGRLFLPKH
ncbi:hypothetical protein BGY98DRAFT_1026469 [Russula aff. rugulosa BPL654]|nr:hypothetical protein BGY98DRAFT_1026469 [Russula aff. rugulosa BPL654]